MDFREEILSRRKSVADNIEKSFTDSDELEKAKNRQAGEMHANGKWVWTQLPSGKFDWRVAKKTSTESPKEATSSKEPKSEVKETKAQASPKDSGNDLDAKISDVQAQIKALQSQLAQLEAKKKETPKQEPKSDISMKTFEDTAKNSKDLNDFLSKVQAIKGVPKEVADEFFNKYGGGDKGKVDMNTAAKNFFDKFNKKEEPETEEKEKSNSVLDLTKLSDSQLEDMMRPKSGSSDSLKVRVQNEIDSRNKKSKTEESNKKNNETKGKNKSQLNKDSKDIMDLLYSGSGDKGKKEYVYKFLSENGYDTDLSDSIVKVYRDSAWADSKRDKNNFIKDGVLKILLKSNENSKKKVTTN